MNSLPTAPGFVAILWLPNGIMCINPHTFDASRSGSWSALIRFAGSMNLNQSMSGWPAEVDRPKQLAWLKRYGYRVVPATVAVEEAPRS